MERGVESLLVGRAVDGVEGVECSGRPDAESAHVSAGSQFEEVEFVDGQQGDAGDVTEGQRDSLVLFVNNERTAFLDSSAVAHLSASGSEAAGGFDALDVFPRADLAEHSDGVLCFLQCLDGVVDNEGKLGNSLNRVTLGHGKSGDGGGGNGGASGISSLCDVNLAVPSAPGLVGVEHATSAAHVSESGGTGAGGSSSTDTGDTRNGTTRSPRLGRSLLAGIGGNGIGGSVVLGNIGVNKVDNIWSDWRLEDCWEVNGLP